MCHSVVNHPPIFCTPTVLSGIICTSGAHRRSEAEKIKRKYRRQFQERAEQEAIAAESAAQRKDREAKVKAAQCDRDEA